MVSEAVMAGRRAEFWDVEYRLRQLSKRGDPREKLAATVDFEMIRAELVAVQGPQDRTKGAPTQTACDCRIAA